MGGTTSQYLRGTLDLLVLQTVADNELHGYAIATRIEQRTDGVLQIEDGALYQALHRLQSRGRLESAWGHAESGKRARFYRLTAKGRRELREQVTGWQAYAEAVQKVLQPT
jgi:PadR family transcriptional regulator, regulatory protein PadR